MNKINIKPLSDRILISPISSEEKTSSGIIIPESSREKSQKGIVIDVGDTAEVKINNTVLYSKNAGTALKIEDNDYLIMNENEILAIIQ